MLYMLLVYIVISLSKLEYKLYNDKDFFSVLFPSVIPAPKTVPDIIGPQ